MRSIEEYFGFYKGNSRFNLNDLTWTAAKWQEMMTTVPILEEFISAEQYSIMKMLSNFCFILNLRQIPRESLDRAQLLAQRINNKVFKLMINFLWG